MSVMTDIKCSVMHEICEAPSVHLIKYMKKVTQDNSSVILLNYTHNLLQRFYVLLFLWNFLFTKRIFQIDFYVFYHRHNPYGFSSYNLNSTPHSLNHP